MFKRFTIYCYKQYDRDPESFIYETFGVFLLTALCTLLIWLYIIALINDTVLTLLVTGAVFIVVVIPISLVLIGKHNIAKENQ